MNALLKKRESLLRRIEECSECLRGSITSVCSTCNRAKCICSKSSIGKAYRLTYKDVHQKTHTVYIPRKQLAKAQKMVANYARMRKLIDDLQIVNIAIFKQESKK
jgi:ribosomal protein L31